MAISSYNQVPKKTTVGEAVKEVEQELTALRDEMADLCATIAAQFPDTYEAIPKYQEALEAYDALDTAIIIAGRLDHRVQANTPLTLLLGKQTRSNRPMSQRVRLGNALVRVVGVAELLQPLDEAWQEVEGWLEINATLADVTFPKTYG